MSGPNCGNCRFFKSDSDDPSSEDPMGSCYRYPPTVVTVESDVENGVTSYEHCSRFPVVMDCEWCGEHQFRTTEPKP